VATHGNVDIVRDQFRAAETGVLEQTRGDVDTEKSVCRAEATRIDRRTCLRNEAHSEGQPRPAESFLPAISRCYAQFTWREARLEIKTKQEFRSDPLSDTSDTSDHPSAGLHVLIVRAAFVPDGEQPPPEFSADFSPIKFRATLDPATGAITCDNAGMNFQGDIRAEWHPDAKQGSDGADESTGEDGDGQGNGGADANTPDRQDE
jgi:hypothetical protein